MVANKGYIDADGHVQDSSAYRQYIEAPYDQRQGFASGGDSFDRMDENFEFRGYQEAPMLKKKPSEYVESSKIFVACEPEERLLPETLRIIGEDSVVYASDWPHWDGSYPESLFELEAWAELTPEQKEKILVDNPKRLYDLG